VRSRTWSAILLGGTLGAISGIAVVALAAARVFGGGIQSVAVLNEPARATFVVEQAALYLLIVAGGAVGGAVLALVGYAVGRLGAPGEERFPAGPLAIIGAVIGAVLTFAAARAAIGVGGVITPEGFVSLSVFRAVMVGIIAGATTGVVMGGTVERLSRPEAIGLRGAAWPASPFSFMREAAAAMGLPALAIVLGLGVVFGFSRFLLEADHTVSLIGFGAVSALVLFGAAALASLPTRGGGEDRPEG